MSFAMIPDRLVQSLYLTLIHSLWQGILLVAIVGLIMTATRRASALKRYNLLIGTLVLFTLGSVFTFIHTWNGLEEAQAFAPVAGRIAEEIASPLIIRAAPESFVDGLIQFFNHNAANIVLFWFVMICIRSLQLLLGLHGLRRLRHSATPPADDYRVQYVKDLAAKMGIYQAVCLAESGIAKVPMVIGHLKPLILIPAGLMTALPPAELEAILIHELAHIRRRDYLVNLLQSLTEIIFFFNPAIWWLSSLIRTEREHCCDDIAVNQTSSKKNYIRALVSCEEYQLPAQAYAMAFKGGRKTLTARVKRILSNNNSSLNLMEKSMLAICLVAAGIVMAAFSNKTQTDTPEAAKTEMLGQVAAVDSPDLFSMPQPPAAEEPVASMPEPDAATPPEPTAFPVAAPEPAAQPEPAEEAEPILAVNSDYAIASVEDQEAYQEAEQGRKRANADRRKAEAAKRYAASEQKRAEARARANERAVEAMGRHNEAVANARFRQDEARRRSDEARRKAAESKRSHDEAMRQHEEGLRRHEEALRKHNEAVRKSEEARRAQEIPTNVILSGLVSDGIVGKNDKSLEFKLDANEFIVNDVKQPEPVFRKYKEKYLKASGKCGDSWSVKYKRSID